MATHIKEANQSGESLAYEPAICGLRDYGQLRYAVFDPTNESNMTLFKERIAADKGDLSIGFCWACRCPIDMNFFAAPVLT
jgi:hypothetical protein